MVAREATVAAGAVSVCRRRELFRPQARCLPQALCLSAAGAVFAAGAMFAAGAGHAGVLEGLAGDFESVAARLEFIMV